MYNAALIYLNETAGVDAGHIAPGSDLWYLPNKNKIGIGGPDETFDIDNSSFAELASVPEFVKSQILKQNGQDGKGTWGFAEEIYPKVLEVDAADKAARGNNNEFSRIVRQNSHLNSDHVSTVTSLKNFLKVVKQNASAMSVFDYEDLKQDPEPNESQIKIKTPQRSYLFNLVTRKTTTRIEIDKEWEFEGPGITRNLREFQYIFPKKGTFTSSQYQALEKDGANIQWHDSVFVPTYKFNILRLNLQSIPQKLERSKLLKIGEKLSSLTPTSTGGDWGARTSGASTVNPGANIQVETDIIDGVEGVVDRFASTLKVLQNFRQNDYVKGDLPESGPKFEITYGNRVLSDTPGIDSNTMWIVEKMLEAGMFFVIDRSGFEFWQGPTRTFQYRNQEFEYNGQIWHDYNLATIRDASKVRKIQGVAA